MFHRIQSRQHAGDTKIGRKSLRARLNGAAAPGLVLAGPAALAAAMPASAEDRAICVRLVREAEAKYGIPAGALEAIMRNESGQRDPEPGAAFGDPWVINYGGKDLRFFD
ncbi:hypothetical protein [Azospirillum soli]|uniref:hypothetical protein n=1 Tax=Azospirillum soli TaxID=1304799 RepID=UPI001AEA0B30|nr:hypothetical protein [Azospirillum soli]MBP2315490.1 hypothetical protein [Azospirillum soli]